MILAGFGQKQHCLLVGLFVPGRNLEQLVGVGQGVGKLPLLAFMVNLMFEYRYCPLPPPFLFPQQPSLEFQVIGQYDAFQKVAAD